MWELKRDADREALVTAGVNNSNYYKHVSMRLVGFTDEGSVMEMDVLPEHRNVWGAMHGGVLSGFIDSSCGTATAQYLDKDETVVTLDLRVQFFAPAKDGKIKALGRVVRRTKRYVIAESEVFDTDDKMLARGTTIHVVVKT